MPTKYVLWRVSNGWLMTTETTLWENWDNRKFYAVFNNLKDFSDYVKESPKPGEPGHYSPPVPQLQPRIRGKFASKNTTKPSTTKTK
jgi:hypothetical protein